MYAGIASYGRKFELPVEAITMTLDTIKSEETRLITKMDFQVKFPVDFPPQHKQSILKNMNACYVKKHLYDPPEVTVNVVE
jgi:ribosomal protein S12 methylthiotransferase accessory factor